MEMAGKIQVLKKHPEPHRAQELLEKVYRYALPLMRKYSLKVGTLVEFFPKNANLLGINVNRGQKIAIRLRHARNSGSFLQFEDLLGTMLHELTHNLHGPHNKAFFEYMDKLKAEMQTMLNQGFTGDKWIGAGSRLGGRYARNIPVERAVHAGRAARSAGHRLGGHTAPTLSLRANVLNAAERRRSLDQVCPADKPTIIDLTECDEAEAELLETHAPHNAPRKSPRNTPRDTPPNAPPDAPRKSPQDATPEVIDLT